VRDRSNGAGVVLLTADEVPPANSGPQRFADQVAPAIAEFDPSVFDFLLGPEFVGFDGDECPCQDYSDTVIPQSLDTTSLALTLDWEINDALALKSITGFRTLETNFGRDGDHVPYAQQVELFFFTEYDQWSQELQLSGTAMSERLNWITGLYYYTEDGTSTDFIEFATLDLISGGGFETDTWAAYGQGTYDITDALSLTVGLRYTDEEKTVVIDEDHQIAISFLRDGAAKEPQIPPISVVGGAQTVKDDETETEPYINLSYNFTDELMTYVSYSEGFKGGGAQVRNGPTGFLPRFGPEKAKVYEIGAKWALPNLRTNLSAAGFFTDYEDLQITANVTPPGFQPTSLVTNAGDAEITGIELEVQSRPTDAVAINAGLAWLDAEYDDLLRDEDGNITVPDVTLDHELPNAPEWQFNLSASYDIPTDWGLFTPRVDYSYTDEQFNDAQNNEILRREETHMVNVSLGYETNDGLWSGALFVTNLAEEQVVLAGFYGIFYGDGAVSRPREWGLRIRRSF
jgi:iron complex outermembrane receptor protein